MPSLKCKGVNVDFPFEPYDCQKDYMGKVIECLQKGINGILESPTGTGKTLCLLCSTLAWRHTFIAQQELGRCLSKDELPGDEDSVNYREKLMSDLNQGASGWDQVSEEGRFIERPKIIYASRTHSQLTQAVSQLKDTSYKPRISVLGSREQMCIHPEIAKAESNAAKVHMCRAKVTARLCHFYNNLDHKKGEKEFNDQILDIEDLVTAGKKHKFLTDKKGEKEFNDQILDIEDLVTAGKKHKVCPYYMARELKTSADIVFMPYNYLLDPKARKIHGVELQGNVIIFDEAHNVEKMCEESASFDLSSFDIASCIEVVGQLLNRTREINTLNEQFHGGDDLTPFDLEDLIVLKRLFMLLEKSIVELNVSKEGVTKPASFIFELFNKVNINLDTKDELLKLLGELVTHLTSDTGAFHRAAGLQKFSEVIQIVYSSNLFGGANNCVSEATKYYKVHLKEVELKRKQGGGGGGGSTLDAWIDTSAPGRQKGYVLSYWCFSPGFSMQDLVSQGVRCIILTSGTLSPLNSFKSELKINFPVQLENPHVIERHQMVVGIVTRGPDNKQLDSSYKNRTNLQYIASLGNAIVNFARIVPNGLLVFFPSYPVMNMCLEHWQESKISSRISQYKSMVIEPRGKTDFDEAMQAFYSQVQDPSLNGAAFFAVCRGKVSEGLDFADMNGRAVVITGLPFPPQMDPKVNLKMQYLDEIRRKRQVGLSGHEWYRQQASRAVNQAVGRVIRHKEDYGAILLCDWRFTHADARKQLPAWVKPYVKVYEVFGQCVKDIIGFFKYAEKTLPQPVQKQAKQTVQDAIQPACGAWTASSGGGNVNHSIVNRASRDVDSHVPSLKRNRDGSHVSQSQLRIMYEHSRPSTSKNAINLLDALHQAEASSSSEIPAASTSSSVGDSSSENTESKSDNPFAKPDGVRKKRKIVVKPTLSDCPSSNEDKKNEAELYIVKVKKALSREDYVKFSVLMKAYRSEKNFIEMLTELEKLLLGTTRHPELFRAFYRFVRPADKLNFHRHCLKIFGQGCGYKPEDSLSRTEKEKLKREKGTIESPSSEISNLGNSNPNNSNLDNKTNLNGGL